VEFVVVSTTDGAEDAPGSAPADHAETPVHGAPDFPVVGIGASAGGLEAFSELLEHLPGDPGLALLFVLHVDPHHESHLPEVVSRLTPLPVHEVTQGMAVQPNNIFLIPPNTNMAVTDGVLTLSPRSSVPGQHMPIDHLFRSLASLHKSRAIGVLLSGGGTDGTLGFQAIKAEGGITFAQEEKTANQPSMPRSAILDGCVDYVLPPAGIARQLARLAHHPYTRPAHGEAEAPPGAADVVSEILNLLRSGTEVDFAHYKRSTLRRRILRRMALREVDSFQAYLHLVSVEPDELQALYQDFLIRVTQFFRDPAAFRSLQEKVFPVLASGRRANAPIRIWVAGCSTGEEAYSLAIALLEFFESASMRVPVKILATDLNEAALEKARAGIYLDNIEIDVTSERLRRFFVRSSGHYQISKAVRELCVFSRHNMATDPPFSHLDLVSCRNVLIYMDAALQRRVLPILHFALNPEGFLFLGGSESVAPLTDLFTVVDSKHRIFSKKASVGPLPLELSAYVEGVSHPGLALRKEGGPVWSALEVQREADRIILSRFSPVGVVVDESMTVLQFRGRTAPYLEPAPGLASLDLFRMLREGLLAEVRAAFTQAKSEGASVVREGLRLTEGAQERLINVEVIPFKVPPSGVRFFLVLFRDTPLPAEGLPQLPPPTMEAQVAQQKLHQAQQELAALREYLQSVIEEQESTNEELKSANEEILSANEELQSTNEELQTAKEEAQSANEELVTVNEELRNRNAELAQVNNDLLNVLSGVNIPIVLVSRDLRIRRFTPQAERLFNLIPTDVGRPISDIHANLAATDLVQRTTAVIDTLAPFESEIKDAAGRWYSLRIRPYVTFDGKIDGASIVLVDIDSLTRSLAQAATAGRKEPS
jgi:two-component system CheB/CheR fusion protein